MLSDWFIERPANDPDLPPDSYCSASQLRWACNSTSTGGLTVQLTRLEYQCCAGLGVSLVPEGDAYRLNVTDFSSLICNCTCVFDVQAFVEAPCAPATILWGDQSLELPVEDYSSGEVVVSNQASSPCEALPSRSSDEIAQAFADTSATFTVTRRWVRTKTLYHPVESEYVATSEDRTWTLVFSEDGSSVTVTEQGSTLSYDGTRVEGEPLTYELKPATGGVLIVVARGTGYSAEIKLFGSGLPVTASFLGEVTPGS